MEGLDDFVEILPHTKAAAAPCSIATYMMGMVSRVSITFRMQRIDKDVAKVIKGEALSVAYSSSLRALRIKNGIGGNYKLITTPGRTKKGSDVRCLRFPLPLAMRALEKTRLAITPEYIEASDAVLIDVPAEFIGAPAMKALPAPKKEPPPELPRTMAEVAKDDEKDAELFANATGNKQTVLINKKGRVQINARDKGVLRALLGTVDLSRRQVLAAVYGTVNQNHHKLEEADTLIMRLREKLEPIDLPIEATTNGYRLDVGDKQKLRKMLTAAE